MARILLALLLALTLAIPAGAGGSAPVAGPDAAAAKKKKKKCKKGYVRKRVKVKKGPKKGKRVARCVKRKKKAKKKAPLVPETSGGVYVGGEGPTAVRFIVGHDSDARAGEDSDGITVRLTIPAGAMTCRSPDGSQKPSDQPFTTNWEGTVDRKGGEFRGGDMSGSVSRSLLGRFSAGKRIQLTAAFSGASASSTGGSCTGSARRDVTYRYDESGQLEG